MSEKIGDVVHPINYKVYAVVRDTPDCKPADPCAGCACNTTSGLCAYAPDFEGNDCVIGGFHYKEIE